jgi:hypothetical protein
MFMYALVFHSCSRSSCGRVQRGNINEAISILSLINFKRGVRLDWLLYVSPSLPAFGYRLSTNSLDGVIDRSLGLEVAPRYIYTATHWSMEHILTYPVQVLPIIFIQTPLSKAQQTPPFNSRKLSGLCHPKTIPVPGLHNREITNRPHT